MTDPYFGRATAAHFDMLSLAGGRTTRMPHTGTKERLIAICCATTPWRRGQSRPPRKVALARKLMPEILEQQLEWYQCEWRDKDQPLWLAAIEGWPFEASRYSFSG